MKQILFIAVIILSTFNLKAQSPQIYNPDADAKADIQLAVNKAKAEGKHVFIQIGGNWCPWCIKFHQFVDSDAEIKEYVEDNFVVLHVNYSPENKNEDVLQELGFPQRFGFPVFVVLDGNGKRLHTQNTAYLEEDSGYSHEKVLGFYQQWSPTALDPASYKN